jgi:hypothetical protein
MGLVQRGPSRDRRAAVRPRARRRGGAALHRPHGNSFGPSPGRLPIPRKQRSWSRRTSRVLHTCPSETSWFTRKILEVTFAHSLGKATPFRLVKVRFRRRGARFARVHGPSPTSSAIGSNALARLADGRRMRQHDRMQLTALTTLPHPRAAIGATRGPAAVRAAWGAESEPERRSTSRPSRRLGVEVVEGAFARRPASTRR